jgi:hypothetical protein
MVNDDFDDRDEGDSDIRVGIMMVVLESFRRNLSQDLWGSLSEHLRVQKSILLSIIISYTTIMSTVTSDTPVAKVAQTTGMRKNGKSFSAPRYRACIFRLFLRHRNMHIPCTSCLTISQASNGTRPRRLSVPQPVKHRTQTAKLRTKHSPL